MKTAIIGGGIIGVTTGVVLAEAGHKVTILTRDPIQKTTSWVAAAVAYPVGVEESPRTLRWFTANNQKLSELPGVTSVDWLKCSAEETCDIPFWLESVGGRVLKPEECPYGNKSGIYARLLHIDVDAYYPYMLERFKKAGGNYKIESVSDFDDVPDDFEHIINCTGVYAGALTNDADIHPARGQVVIVKNPGITKFYSVFGSKNYIYPRGVRCVLGGSFDEGAWDITPDDALTKKIIAWAGNIDPRLKEAEVLETRVGLRPLRSTVRLEKEISSDGRTIIHNYGHGGAGYTLAWGCAGDVVKLV